MRSDELFAYYPPPASVRRPSAMQQMLARVSSGRFGMRHVEESVHAIRQSGESLVVGGVLGAMHAAVGLDIKGKIPVDLLLGIVGMGFGAYSAGEPTAIDARNIGAAALTTFAFRQTYGLIADKKISKGETPTGGFKPLLSAKMHGDDEFDAGADPIVELAKSL